MQTNFENILSGTAQPARAISNEALVLIADRFKLLSEPTRLRLLAALKSGEKNVTELVTETGATQANVSRHLHALTLAGILGRRKEGLNVYYTIADVSIFQLCELVCHGIQTQLDRQNQAMGRH